MHVDIGIMAVGIRWPPDRDEYAVRITAILQDVPVAVIFGKGRAVAGAHRRLAAIIDQHGFAGDHHHELVLAFVPVPL